MRRLRRRIAITAGLLLGAVALVYLAGEIYQARDCLPRFVERKGDLVSIDEVTVEEAPASVTYRLELRDSQGLKVEAYLRVPTADVETFPVVVILGGVRTGMDSLEFLGPSSAILLALDYPYWGKHSRLSNVEVLQHLPAMRRAMFDFVPAAMLALDYLWQRDDVDRERVLLAGGSFGALVAPAVAAAEPRFSAVAILFGAGDLHSLLRANLDYPAPIREILAWIGAIIVSPMEPLKYVHRIAPRPVFMLTGIDDSVMPERSSILLHEAAREPKTVRRIPAGHVRLKSAEFHRLVVEELVEWLVAIEFIGEDEAVSFLQLR